ncbi:MAG: cysteine sulfinate desulfinase [Halothiobacillus sp. 14-56-357]|jgi:cysteine desulfurase/selenocysteine lyase|uniref:aminotransferase class V-fold PLP-dependent enzyme n=1 Tax=Halothiobacillus sp. 15-55-196 TaxID=1970382 RepID=UPI000BD9B068|nr:cysteine desulfurase [Halothiobacillus sp. 15-55-196]OZB35877.1 MAG: cysteine sulfinate desulfinase [Halothiobacillus sp. 15-55-196]OZB56699.1 MAG: cysteine sulfinate desulfinase [Halothiobacillus sp. 14-56-357]OZB79259.1 MAG: cysteine sulfinate desulfinase [Halothiobacillus sp. 13-55-115]
MSSLKLDVAAIRKQFPALDQTVNGKPLVYLDNAATTQKPKCVIEAVSAFYRHDNANIHRGVHTLSARATDQYEAARERVRLTLNASATEEIVFVRGTTEAINLVASSFGQLLKAGDEIIISALEHHANIVPWHLLKQRIGITLNIIPVTPEGELNLDALPALITDRTRLIAVNHVSNALGTINPVAQIAAIAKAHGVPILIDGAQGLPHGPVDVQAIDCDFYTLSGHKTFAPSGIGVLYARRPWLDDLPPYQGGGDMIETVSFDTVRYAPPPAKFEAGTPNIEGAIGLNAALQWHAALDWPAIKGHEAALLAHATTALEEINGLRIIGRAKNKVPVLSFIIEGAHPHDIGMLLDAQGIAVRTGQHCAMPVLQLLGAPLGTVRASFAFYNTLDEVDALVCAVHRAQHMLS